MSTFRLNRRRFLSAGALGASSLVLSGCDVFDGFADRAHPLREFMTGANDLTYRAQRLLAGNRLAPEFSESDIRQPQRPNGVTRPEDDDYQALLANDFRDWRLEVTGLVDTPLSLSREQLKHLHAAALAINARDLAAQGLQGPQIGEALAKARIAAIAAARKAGT